MPYLISTTQKSTATSKAVAGNFLGADGHQPVKQLKTQVVVSCVDRLLVYEASPQGRSLGSPVDQRSAHVDPTIAAGAALCPTDPSSELRLIGEFPLFASVLLMEAVPIVHPTTRQVERHVLFVFTAKDQYIVYALVPTAMAAPSPSSSGEGALHAAASVALVPLYGDVVESSFYQPHYNGALLSAATTADVLVGLSSSEVAEAEQVCNPPMVAMTIFHKNILLFDIACCLAKSAAVHDDLGGEETPTSSPVEPPARRTKRPRRQPWTVASLFSEAFWRTTVAPRSAYAPMTVQYLDETTVACLAFGYAPSPAAQQLPVYVLHSDAKQRKHLSEYVVRTEGVKATAAPTGADAVQLAILGLGFDATPTQYPLGWARVGLTQTDLELEAHEVIALRRGVCVVGVQLVTHIAQRGSSKTEVIPQRPTGASDVRACVPIDGLSFFAAFCDGTIFKVSLKPLDDESEVLGGATAGGGRLVVARAVEDCNTSPDCLAIVSVDHIFIGSLMGNAVSVWVPTETIHVALENTGPIIDMAVVKDGSRTGVIASNGVDRNGGLYLLRTAVQFHEDMQLPWIEGICGVHLVGDTTCLSFPTHSRFLRFGGRTASSSEALATAEDISPNTISLEEVDGSSIPLVFDEETLLFDALLGSVSGSNGFLQVTRRRYVVCASWASNPTTDIHVVAFDGEPVGHAAFGAASNLLAVSQGSRVTVHNVAASLERTSSGVHHGRSFVCNHEVSCLSIAYVPASGWWVVVGEWMSHVVTLRSYDRWEEDAGAVLSVTLSSVPKSIVVCPMRNGVSDTTVCCGLADGSLVFVALTQPTADAPVVQAIVVQESKLSLRPVHLAPIPGGMKGSGAVLCCSDVPAMVYEQDGRIAVTGVALDDMEFASCTSTSGPGNGVGLVGLPSMVVASPASACIRYGGIKSAQKVSRTANPAIPHQTVCKVTYLHHFHCVGIGIRCRDRDEVALLTASSGFGVAAARSTDAGILAASEKTVTFALMDNERCNFIESLVIGGPNDKPMSDAASRNTFATPSKTSWRNDTWRAEHGSSPFNAVVVGASTVYVDESFPRTSRVIWGSVERSEDSCNGNAKLQFAPLGEREFVGAATCCSAVPNCPNRIAVGVNGSVHLLRWHASDRTFVSETNLSVGNFLVSVSPLFPPDDITTGILVVADWKHSISLVKVNPIDNSLELVARDGSLRGVMDVQIVLSPPHSAVTMPPTMAVDNPPSAANHEFVFADEMMNLFSVTQEIVDAAAAAAPPRSTNVDEDEEALNDTPPRGRDDAMASGGAPQAPVPHWTARKRLLTVAQTHIGDRISALVKGDLTPCASLAAQEAIRGASDQRFLYGTIHGAIGTITPIAELPFRVYERIEQHTAVVGRGTAGGGLDYAAFREVSAVGQARGANTNPSFGNSGGDKRLKKKRRQTDANAAIPYAMDDTRYVAKGCAHGDVVEHFLKLCDAEQAVVVCNVNRDILTDVATGRYGFPLRAQPTKKKPTVLDELMPSAADARDDDDNSAEGAVKRLTDADMDEANDALLRWRLPTLPFTVDTVRTLVLEMLRTH